MPKYDVAIVGAGLGGLAAAALLSGKKRKVIVLERSGSVDGAAGVYGRDGYNSCAAPTLSYGFERGGAFYKLSANLGIAIGVSVHSPCYQVALPDHRITVYADHGETLEELRREFPKEINTLIKFYRELHSAADKAGKSRLSAYFLGHRSASGFIGKYRFSSDLTAFFDIQSLYFFQRPLAEISLANLIALCDTPPLYLEGGFKKLAERLYEAILQQGGEIIFNQTGNEFDLKGDRIIGIKTKQGVIEADTILLDQPPRHGLSTVFLGLPDTVVPVGMCPEVLFLPDYGMPRDFIALSLSAKDDIAYAPRGMRMLRMSSQSEQSAVVGKHVLIERLNRLIPFLNDHLVFSDEYRTVDGELALPEGVIHKPFRSIDGISRLFRGSRKNVYLLKSAEKSPLQVISDITRFAEKVS